MKVVVIGGGIVGLCTAFELADRGVEVTVVNEGGPETGTSIGNAGMIVPSHFDPIASPAMLKLGVKMMANPSAPFGFRDPLRKDVASWCYRFLRNANADHCHRTRALIRDLNVASRDLYRNYESRLATEIGYHGDGLLMLCRTLEALKHEAKVIEEAKELGLKTDLLGPAEVQKLNPNIELRAVGAVHFRDDAQLTPRAVLTGLRQAILAKGGKIFDHQRISKIARNGRRIEHVSSDQQEFVADEYVLAAGLWSGELAGKLGLNIPLMGGKGYGFTLPQPSPQLGICAILVEDRVAVSPMLDGMRVTGTMEMGPVSHGINQARLDGVYAALPRYFEGIDLAAGKRAPVWTGYRPCPPDGLPVMGRTRHYENLLIGTGHGMMGLSLGAITGHLLTQVLHHEPTDISLDMFHPDRFN